MAGSSSKSNPPRARKRVEAETTSLKRAKDGSAFTRCKECNKDVPVVLIDMHNCSLDSRIKMHLESEIVEKVAEISKPVVRKKAVSSEKKGKKSSKMNDPNMPKRPPTAFFLFMADFRIEFKKENPDNKSVAVVGKEGGEKWKSLSDEEKKPYLDQAAKLKLEHAKTLAKLKAGEEEEELEDKVGSENEDAEDKEETEEKEEVEKEET